MKQNRILQGGIALLIVGALAIFALWYFVLRTPLAATEPIQSIPLSTSAPSVTIASEQATAPAATDVAVEAPTTEVAATEEPTIAPTEPPAAKPVLFEISQADSEVRFTLDELLRGNPKTVVGVSNQVAGQISVDFNDLSTIQVGIIQVNARTFATDNEFRNNAIQNRILHTNDFEFITFTPTNLSGLPDSVAIGDSVTFAMTGDLTIQDVTTQVTFDVTATAVSAERIEGLASTTIQRADYGLNIPNAPGVADVDEAVLLEIDFVALATTN